MSNNNLILAQLQKAAKKPETPKKKTKSGEDRRVGTSLQRRAIADVKHDMETRGKVSVSKSMRKAGYNPASAKNPKTLTGSRAWEELMEEYLPDNLLAEKHCALLNKTEVIARNNNDTGKIEIKDTNQIDAGAVKAGLDMAYKLKKKYPKDSMEIDVAGLTELTNVLKTVATIRGNNNAK